MKTREPQRPLADILAECRELSRGCDKLSEDIGAYAASLSRLEDEIRKREKKIAFLEALAEVRKRHGEVPPSKG